MKTVLLSQKLHQKALDMLEGKVNILIPEEQGQAAFDALVPQADAILLRTNVKLTAEAIKNAPNLKIVCRTGAGTDNVDKEALKEKGIILTNTPRANSISVAEHAVSLALALAKRLPVYDAETRKGGWLIRSSNTSTEITGKTVGIIGLGNIGRNAAEMFRLGFGMKVIGFDPFVKEDPNYTIVDDPAEVFRQADIISLHCPKQGGLSIRKCSHSQRRNSSSSTVHAVMSSWKKISPRRSAKARSQRQVWMYSTKNRSLRTVPSSTCPM